MGDELRKDFQKARMAEAVEAGDIDVVASRRCRPIRRERLGRSASPSASSSACCSA